MPRVADVTFWRRRLFEDMESLSAGELREKYDLSPGVASRWMRARKDGEDITHRVNNYYQRVKNGEGRRKDTGAKSVTAWVYKVLDMIGEGAPTAEIAAKNEISEKTVTRWRDRHREGDDIRPLLRMYYYRHFRGMWKRRNTSRDTGCHETDAEAMRAVVNGEKCAMCGVWFAREHGRAVVCRDCRKRRDFKPRIRRYNRRLQLARAWHEERGV